MFKMDTTTKQVFLTGMIAYFSTVIGLVYHAQTVQENHNVRITQLEKADDEQKQELKNLLAEVVTLRTEGATITVMLETLNQNVAQLNKTTNQLTVVAAKLEERSKK